MTDQHDPTTDETTDDIDQAELFIAFAKHDPLVILLTVLCMWVFPLAFIIGDVELVNFTFDLMLVTVPPALVFSYRFLSFALDYHSDDSTTE